MQVPKCGSAVDTVSLYADDMLQYLADQGPSRQVALETMDQFADYSGLLLIGIPHFTIRCFYLLAVIVRHCHLSEQTLLNAWVFLSEDPVEYLQLNIETLKITLKTKIQIWSKPGVLGRVILIKMMLSSKILYMFWHSPIYTS